MPLHRSTVPVIFVLLWSTGFIGARLGLPHAEPLTFLTVRFVMAAAILAVVALVLRSPWPRRPVEVIHAAVAGLLVHALYLGGVFVGIARGVDAGLASLIVSTQPILVAALSGLALGEWVRPRQWLGMALGLGGVLLVLARELEGEAAADVGALACGAALLGISAGTLYQKRFGGAADLVTGNAVQYAVSALACGGLAVLVEEGRLEFTAESVTALLWLVLVLSIGAVTLLYRLIRRGAAARGAGRIVRVPPVTAVLAWAIFGETLDPLALVGMAVAVLGVAAVVRAPRAGP